MMGRSRLLLPVLILMACEGAIEGGGGPSVPEAGPAPDAGADAIVIPEECGEAGTILVYFEQTCASSGACHQAGAQFPDLTRGGIPRLVDLRSEQSNEPILTAGDPEGSWLYRKMAGLQGEDGGGVMPAGRRADWDELPADVRAVGDWIRNGAPATCDGLPSLDLPYDPNTLDRDALFTCESGASAPSEARYRRIERLEFTHSVARRRDAANSNVIDNPLETPVAFDYATFAEGVSVDAATLAVFLLSLPEANALWRQQGLDASDSFAAVDCFYRDEAPDDHCIDAFVDFTLRRGGLYRRPSEFERTHLREHTVRALAAESDMGERRATAGFLFDSLALTSGALFRAEVAEDDGTMRGDRMALALGRMLSTHPVGSIKLDTYRNVMADPDLGRHADGWLAAIADAGEIPEGAPGSIFDADVRRDLVRRYAGGVDPDRGFWELDESRLLAAGNAPGPGRVGEFWIASEFVRFFRQWLDYENADGRLKDHPSATSRFVDYDFVDEGFDRLQGGGSREGRLTHQLDDWIARLVIETDRDGSRNFWRELMLGRLWHLPATGRGPACTSSADCTEQHASCGRLNDCRNTSGNVRRDHLGAPLVFGVEDRIEATQAGRWVNVPESERLGVLTHPTWLAAHGGNFEDDPSIIERGKWIRERIFCQTVPPLTFVEVEAQLIPPSEALSARDRVRMSTESDGRCISCHAQMNSLGYPFELYNHAGFLRDEDHGRAPDGSTVIDNLPTGSGEDLNGAYASPFELIDAMANSQLAKRGFIRHAFRYSMGRDERASDACTLAAMEQAFDARGSFIDMIGELAASAAFTERTVGGAE